MCPTRAERRGALLVMAIIVAAALGDAASARFSRPRTFEPTGAAVRDSSARARSASAGRFAPVDINRAAASQLETLPGIGPVLARRIVAHRARHGPFRRPEELLAVRGIGPRLFERLRPRVATPP